MVSDTYEEEAGVDVANAEDVQERHDEVESLVDEGGTSVDGNVVCDVLVAVVEYWVYSVADDGLEVEEVHVDDAAHVDDVRVQDVENGCVDFDGCGDGVVSSCCRVHGLHDEDMVPWVVPWVAWLHYWVAVNLHLLHDESSS